MDRGGVSSMDAAGQDGWDWEVLPDHMSSSMCYEKSANLADDQETKEHVLLPRSSDPDVHHEPVVECKDIGVVLDGTVVPSKEEEEEAMPEVTDPLASDGTEEQEKALQSPVDTKESHDEKFDEAEEASDGREDEEQKAFQSPADTKRNDDGKVDEEEEEEDDCTKKKDNLRARPDCVVFSVGKLKVNGIGALCSFGVAAATVCIFLIGGKMQHHQHRQQQQQKIQLQFFGDDNKSIQQVVQQTSRLNQAVSSVMGGGGGGGGASARANISFGGFYDGF